MSIQSVIPELALIEDLPPHWRARFEKALEFWLYRLDQLPPPSWDEVAAHCAVSPQHFHRMFVSVFHETPGQYLSRMRLQQAVNLLLHNGAASITEIALATGYSSSQALAKALRRELKTSAKAIRKIGSDPQLAGLSELLRRLGHPQSAQSETRESLEEQMARALTYEILSLPERVVHGWRLQNPTWEILAEVGSRQLSTELVMLTESETLGDATLNDFEVIAGAWVSESAPRSKQSLTVLPAGDYFSCTANLESEIAYFSVWREFDRRLLQNDLDVPKEGHMVEIIHDANSMLNDVSVMTFQMLVVPAA